MSTPLIICADDFGYSDAVDRGIARLVELGRITATSCLTSSPRWPRAAAAARTLRGRADLGLHLDLTEFARAATLPRLLLTARLGLLDVRRVHAMLVEQLTRFEDTLGAAPDYVDGHQHVHQLPAVADLLIGELRARYAARLPWVRLSLPAGRDLKSRVIAATGARRFAASLDRAGIRRTQRLLGIYDFGAEPAYPTRLAGWLAAARAGDALMVHPADGANADDPLGAARQREYDCLADAATGACLAGAAVRPARGDALPIRGAA